MCMDKMFNMKSFSENFSAYYFKQVNVCEVNLLLIY